MISSFDPITYFFQAKKQKRILKIISLKNLTL